MLVEECLRCYQKSWCAVSTLCGAKIRKRLLQRMETRIGRQTFDGGDTATLTFDRENQTGKDRKIVEQDSTCPAFAEFASMLGAAQI